MFSLSPVVAQTLQQNRAVVALESTVIAHGLPAPHNLETAQACEAAVRESGAEPATIGILAGQPVIGLTKDQLQTLASRPAGPDAVAKVNLSNLGACLAQNRWGATTVASTLHFARMAGIKVFATGGIGGVHRGASESFDISADLNALGRYPVITVCAGAKAILDLAKTMEVLETLGVPVIGYQTDELPAFYSRSSGIKLDLRADSAEEVAAIAAKHWQLGFSTSVLVVAPVPAEDEVPADEIKNEIDEALAAAALQGITGKAVTPFLLSRIAARTEGRALRANIALLKNNARIAGQIANAMNKEN
ncbi:MAG TPA: pseudouridine-5'-phosphate glycosidase [Blastocatellia bacterium]